MKLENNSLKYGINVDNNVTSTYNNAYQNEMENQRNMQTQITQRQRTLLDAIDSENKQKLAAQQAYFGYDPKTGQTLKPMDAANLDAFRQEINKDEEAGLYPNTTLRKDIYNTIPVERRIDSKTGKVVTTLTPKPYTFATPSYMDSPVIVKKSSLLGYTPEEYMQTYNPDTVVPKRSL